MVDGSGIVRNSLYTLGACALFGVAGYFLGKDSGENAERKRTIEALTARASDLKAYADYLDLTMFQTSAKIYDSRVFELERFADSLKKADSTAGGK